MLEFQNLEHNTRSQPCLGITDVSQELSVRCSHVKVVHCRFSWQLCITKPATALSLRAVRGNTVRKKKISDIATELCNSRWASSMLVHACSKTMPSAAAVAATSEKVWLKQLGTVDSSELTSLSRVLRRGCQSGVFDQVHSWWCCFSYSM